MHADRFRALLDTTGPFVSVYFDDSHDTADAVAQLDSRLRDIRKHLEERAVDQSVIEAIRDAAQDDKVAAILGRVEVPLEGAGSVQVIGPYQFTLGLYDPRKRDLDSADGIGEVIVAGYVSKDRHGAQLTGALYEGAEGDAKGGGGGEGTRTKHSTGVWPERSKLYR